MPLCSLILVLKQHNPTAVQPILFDICDLESLRLFEIIYLKYLLDTGQHMLLFQVYPLPLYIFEFISFLTFIFKICLSSLPAFPTV
jgi:hypothetical protein